MSALERVLCCAAVFDPVTPAMLEDARAELAALRKRPTFNEAEYAFHAARCAEMDKPDDGRPFHDRLQDQTNAGIRAVMELYDGK